MLCYVKGQKSTHAAEENHLTSGDEIDAFKEKHDVKTTPQTFIDGQRVGGYEEVRKHLGKKVKDPDATSYRPVAVF